MCISKILLPKFVTNCEKIVNSIENSKLRIEYDWAKVSKRCSMVSSINLRQIDCNEETSDNSDTRVIKVTSDDDVFELWMTIENLKGHVSHTITSLY